MKNFNRRAITVALLLTLGTAFSMNAHSAEPTNIETSISEMLVTQGQQVVSDLSAQLQASISEEINSFSIDFSFDESITESLAWLTEDEESVASEQTKLLKQVDVNAATATKSL